LDNQNQLSLERLKIAMSQHTTLSLSTESTAAVVDNTITTRHSIPTSVVGLDDCWKALFVSVVEPLRDW
jgi:hypothetical protein